MAHIGHRGNPGVPVGQLSEDFKDIVIYASLNVAPVIARVYRGHPTVFQEAKSGHVDLTFIGTTNPTLWKPPPQSCKWSGVDLYVIKSHGGGKVSQQWQPTVIDCTSSNAYVQVKAGEPHRCWQSRVVIWPIACENPQVLGTESYAQPLKD